MNKNLLDLSIEVSRELERVCRKLELDDYQKDMIDNHITSVFTKHMTLDKIKDEEIIVKYYTKRSSF